jgi:hypothetical protein
MSFVVVDHFPVVEFSMLVSPPEPRLFKQAINRDSSIHGGFNHEIEQKQLAGRKK